jgi:hypothetical protein
MSARLRSWSPWLALAALWACLNPQPDTNPLSPEATPVVDVSAPPTVPGNSNEGGGMVAQGPDPDRAPPATPPAAGGGGFDPDAGAPPAQPDAGSGADAVTFSTTDAGTLAPDAGAAD